MASGALWDRKPAPKWLLCHDIHILRYDVNLT